MAIESNHKQFSAEYDGVITTDVYVGKGWDRKNIASPGDKVEVGDLAQGQRTLCRLKSGELYWIENGSWSVE